MLLTKKCHRIWEILGGVWLIIGIGMQTTALAQPHKVVVLEFADPNHSDLRQVVLDVIASKPDVTLMVTGDVMLTATQAEWDINSPKDRKKLAKELGISEWIVGQVDERWKAVIRLIDKRGTTKEEAVFTAKSRNELRKVVNANIWAALGHYISDTAKQEREEWLKEQARQNFLAGQKEFAKKKAEDRREVLRHQRKLAKQREALRLEQLEEQRQLAMQKGAARSQELKRQKELVRQRELEMQRAYAQQQQQFQAQQLAKRRAQALQEQQKQLALERQQQEFSANQYFGQQISKGNYGQQFLQQPSTNYRAYTASTQQPWVNYGSYASQQPATAYGSYASQQPATAYGSYASQQPATGSGVYANVTQQPSAQAYPQHPASTGGYHQQIALTQQRSTTSVQTYTQLPLSTNGLHRNSSGASYEQSTIASSSTPYRQSQPNLTQKGYTSRGYSSPSSHSLPDSPSSKTPDQTTTSNDCTVVGIGKNSRGSLPIFALIILFMSISRLRKKNISANLNLF